MRCLKIPQAYRFILKTSTVSTTPILISAIAERKPEN